MNESTFIAGLKNYTTRIMIHKLKTDNSHKKTFPDKTIIGRNNFTLAVRGKNKKNP